VNLADLIATGIGGPATADSESLASITYQIRNQGLSGASSNAIAQRI